MIIDLATCESDLSREADVVIIGAGIAGLTLANRLRRERLHVVVVESGGREPPTQESHPLNKVVQLADPYHGGTCGRSRCLGGTSTKWGGALIPFVEHDLEARPYLGLPGFPVDNKAVRTYLPQVEAMFAVDQGSYEEDLVATMNAESRIPTGDGDFIARFAKWPVFKRRNMAVLFKDAVERDKDLEIWINANVTRFGFDRTSGAINSVEARHESGRKIVLAARRFVICAGGIESTRLLLLLDRQHDQRIFEDCNALGRFFYDHVSAPVATIKAKRPTDLNRMAAFRFVGATMRSLRYELSAAAQERECMGSAFGHISFRTDRRSGFDALRDLLRTQQRSGRLQPALMLDALRDVPYLVNLARWRTFNHQLLWPANATYELHVVVEQLPQISNQIALASETDPFGSPLAAINWRVGAQERAAFDNYKKCFDAFWKRRRLDALGELVWLRDAGSADNVPTAADVYHPGGSTRMGADPRSAVVDGDLKVFGVNNLWVASTSTFPSGGGANPTLTLLLFTLRLADHLAKGVTPDGFVAAANENIAPRAVQPA